MNMASSSPPKLQIRVKEMAGSSIQEANPRAHHLLGRVAIVTGGSGGIGRTVALHLASLSANLVVNYASNSTEANLLVAEINSSTPSLTSHPQAIAVRANVSDAAQIKALFDEAEKAFGTQVHILVNCAGVLNPKYPILANTSEEDWDKTFEVNTKGTFLCSKEAANRLKHGGGGRIISFSTSLVGLLSPGYAAYASSKAAVEAMTKIMAKELKGTQITANCVAPGPIATDMFFAGKSDDDVEKMIGASPLNRLGKSSDVAPLVGFLASDAGEWINGQVIRVNGGLV